MRIVAMYGSAPVAAYTIALRLIEFAVLPAWIMGRAQAASRRSQAVAPAGSARA